MPHSSMEKLVMLDVVIAVFHQDFPSHITSRGPVYYVTVEL